MITGGSYSSLYWGATLCVFVNYFSPVTTSNTTTTGRCDNVPTIGPTMQPHRCGTGPLCYHGKCTRIGTSFNCVCDEGWIPPLVCNTCCPLSCSGHGQCYGSMNEKNWTFKCICDDSHKGTNCETPKCIKKCINGKCTIEGDRQVCHCEQDFSGDYCENVNPKYRGPWYKPTVGTLSTLGVLLMLFGVLMPYAMWRQRALIILRIHYFIKRYRDNYSLPYDAFISCTSDSDDDLDFVREVLCPTLESSMGYRVCYGDRDFGAGSLIDSMCEAVRSSRRTILILSPDYVDDTWPNFEVQIAQHESLRSGHRIIPIIYRQIDTISQPSLRNVVSSLQCLKWPQRGNKGQLKDFWKKLRVLMPKARTPDQRLMTTWQSEV